VTTTKFENVVTGKTILMSRLREAPDCCAETGKRDDTVVNAPIPPAGAWVLRTYCVTLLTRVL
jgi:hypothetical protein